MFCVGVAAEAVPTTVKFPVMSTWSLKTASSCTNKSPLVVMLSVVESPKVKSPLTARSPSIVTSSEKVLSPAIVWAPVNRTASPLNKVRFAFRSVMSESLLVTWV